MLVMLNDHRVVFKLNIYIPPPLFLVSSHAPPIAEPTSVALSHAAQIQASLGTPSYWTRVQ